ncbi:DUF2089 family protein [Methylophaga sp. OBS4]|uniref:DUF2089 family protein n=1 Tax=Methylophaga sp. OBS4 TaxID=2991935 RepID=UPI002251E93D|nr:DUF2089 family protein [Methylophaga sp. OBS4]MCX4186722.1 DUF2089 domain-containing protein [Methylophaga sp. OBS4]
MNICPICHSSDFHPVKMRCADCNIEVGGKLHISPLGRLSGDHQSLAMQLVLHGGNLKTLAEALNITYPTLRRRLDQTITELKNLLAADEALIASLLDQIKHGEIKSEEGIRRIREIQNEL